MTLARRRWRAYRMFIAASASVLLMTGLALVAPPAQAGAPAAPGGPAGSAAGSAAGKIEPALRTAFDSGGGTDFWIRFEDRADLSQARQVTGWAARGDAVTARLRETARASQAEVIQALDAGGYRYRAFFVTNAIYVHDGPASLASELSARPEVEGLYQPSGYELVEPTPSEVQQQIQSIAWGIRNIRADQAWDEFGVRGEGITVATIDSGVQFDHPALVDQYRGNLGNGEFDHNYNWFDAAGNCPDAPCDPDGHGTHVTGTMIGDDGGANQIGVAPGASWIAANGCCPSDAALIASGQWLLAPTDLAGGNPDPSRRPHIINNSWGTVVPSNDPFMEDVLEAWAAAGIFGMWSNGNNGPGCETSGSPGSRTINYSAGAHGPDNTAAEFSSRGPGQDSGIKPDISAPGVDVRSSLPGNRYGSKDGTSMAAPHVAGAVALLWSAVPGLVGDIQATVELLDLSAVDTEDLRCGGTAGNNNVYGQGRLDALGLLEIAPINDIGTVTGTVTDAGGDPLEGATVRITGPVERERTIGPGGTYSVLLPAGDYTVTASAFGYAEQTVDVTVVIDGTATRDFALEEVDQVTVSGRVTDGSGHGWPMYARIHVPDTPVDTYTDPVDGTYRFDLPVNNDYTFVVEPQYPDYVTLTEPVEVGGTDLVRDLAVTVDAATCTAPGYRFGSDGVFTTFNAGVKPEGWTVVDHIGNGQVWAFDNPADRNNLTGGDGGFATVDGSFHGNSGDQDTDLLTPVLDLSDVADPEIRFDHSLGHWLFGDQIGEVDLSLDGGATWQNLLHLEDEGFQDRAETIPIPQAAGQSQVRVRFHYSNTSFGFWWQIDNVLVGTEITCDPAEGGLVLGNVRDLNTGAGVSGATVGLAGVDQAKTSMPTPDDPGLDDGFYWFFSPGTGDRELTASATRYTDRTATVHVVASSVTHADLPLAAGRLSFDPAVVAGEVRLGGSGERVFSITNTGTAPAEVELRERGGPFTLREPGGQPPDATPSPAGPAERRLAGPVTDLSMASAGAAFAEPAAAAPAAVPHEPPWHDLASYPFRVMDNIADVWDGRVYSVSGIDETRWRDDTVRYDPVTRTWAELAAIPTPRERPNGAIIDGKFYVVGGWDTDGDTTIRSLEIYDIASDSWTAGTPIPTAWAASASAVLDGKLYLVGGCRASCGSTEVWVYDPAADAWSQAAPYPRETSWAHCGGIDGLLYCAGGSRGPAADGYVYDPARNQWQAIAPLPQARWGATYAVANGRLVVSGGVVDNMITNTGIAYDPRQDAWEPIANANHPRYRAGGACGFYRVGGAVSGGFAPSSDAEVLPGFDECLGDVDVPWLSFNPPEARLEPGESVTVTVVFDADLDEVDQPGTYSASLLARDDTPYLPEPLAVTLEVTPPKHHWGLVSGTVSGISCDGEEVALSGATVRIVTKRQKVVLTTDGGGRYGYWLSVDNNPLRLVVSGDGYREQSRRGKVMPRRETVEDFTLLPASCSGAGHRPA